MSGVRPALVEVPPARTPEPAAVRATFARGTHLRRALALGDVAAVLAALGLAVLVSGRTDRGSAMLLGAALAPAWVLLFKLYGLYDRDDRRISHATVDDAPWVFHAVLVGALGVWLALKLAPTGRFVLAEALVFFVAANAFVLGARSFTREAVRRLEPAERVLFVGGGPMATVLERKMRVHPEYGLEPIGELAAGEFGELEEVCRARGIDRLVVAPTLGARVLADVVRRSRRLDVRLSIVPDGVDVLGPSVVVDDVEGVTVLGLNPPALTRSSRALKRAMDVVVAGTALVACAPLLAAVALAVKLTSPGPVLFVQERVGLHGRPFRLAKFRTMVADAERRAAELRAQSRDPHWLLLDDDPRVTRLGRVLRHTSLDELPQLWNVLRGDMSLVGPRPLTVDDAANVSGWGLERLDLVPGLTGLWQVLGRTTIPFEEMVKLDWLYVTNWSLWSDVRLLVRTVPAVFLRRGVN
jgi:exopolysaccharide biosynthesis polyprenyl glycosylphosphotransferase